MAVTMDFALAKYEDGVLTIGVQPPTPIGGWEIQYFETKHFGAQSGLTIKSCASGFNGTSGVTVINSGQGVFTVRIFGSDSSGREPGPYAYQVRRVQSGAYSILTDGYHLMRD